MNWSLAGSHKISRLMSFFSIAVLIIALPISAKVVYVNKNASGSNNGTSWANAYTELYVALMDDNAVAGDEIWVAKGTYTPLPNLLPRYWQQFFPLKSNVNIYGGFAGGEIQFSQRNFIQNKTVLTKPPGGVSEGIVHGSNFSLIDGFTISGSNKYGVFNQALQGGSPIQVANCIISNNQEMGIWDEGSNVETIYSEIRDNPHGGVYSTGAFIYETIKNSVLENNGDGAFFGAFTGYYSDNLQFVNCIFYRNTNRAMFLYRCKSSKVVSCNFIDNYAAVEGGAIRSHENQTPALLIQNSIFWNNSAPDGSQIYFDGVGSVMDISHSLIEGGFNAPYVTIGIQSTLNDLGGNTSADPQFLSSTDFRLGPGSPAINAGDPATSLADYPGGSEAPLDLGRNPRVVGSRVDIGAYEYQFTPSPNSIPFYEDWQIGQGSRWNKNLAAGDGITATGNGNNALCMGNTSSSVNASFTPGTVTTVSMRVRAASGGVGSNPYGLTWIYGPGFDVLVQGNKILLHDRQGSIDILPDVWYTVRLELDPVNNQERWYLNDEEAPRLVINGYNHAQITSISVSGGGKNVCWDDIYVGNEYTLTVADPANGDVTATGWIRSTPGTTAKYVYRQMTSGYPVAELNAIPSPGYKLTAWTGAAASFPASNPTINLIMNSNKSASATFGASPTYTVTRYWNGVATPSITATEGIPFNTMQNLPGTLSPPLSSFEKWEPCVEPPVYPGKVILLNGNQGKVVGGNACIMAKFYDPEVSVEVRDIAVGDNDSDNMESEPRIKITNTGKTPLSDFYFEYYFHSECLNVPLASDFQVTGLEATLINMNRGNFRILFHYTDTQPINPGSFFETQSGHLAYACTQTTNLECPHEWNTSNDYSLLHDGSLFDYGKTTNLPVYASDPANAGVNPIKDTHVPVDFKYDDPAPGPDVPNSITFAVPSSLALPIPGQYPNLITAQAFPLGNYIVNGSFENDSLGWKAYPQDITFPGGTPADAKRLEIAFHSHDAHAYDGYRYMIVHSYDDAVEEGIYYEIPESSPTFKSLMANNGTGLEGNGVVFSAWARKTSGNSAIKLAIWTGESGNPIIYYPSITLSSSPSEWTFISQHISQLIPYTDASGVQSLRFVIMEEAHASGDFQLDGVTLIPGSKYLAPNVSQTLFNTRMAKIQSRTLLPGEAPGIRPDEGSVILTNTEYDVIGRVKKSYLPYSETCPTNNCNPYFQAESFTADVLSAANAHYDSDLSDGLPNAGGFAYSETSYENDQVTTIDGNGKPGANHNLASGHVERTFYSGVSTLNPADLTSTPSGGTVPGTLEIPGNASNPKYAYKNVTDDDGRTQLEWKDGFGQVAQTAAVVDKNSHQYALTRNLYDSRGNLIRTLPPMSCRDENGNKIILDGCVEPTSFVYDDENRMVKEINPDAGETRYFYDLLGRLKASQTPKQLVQGRATISNFDKLGRIVETGEWIAPVASEAEYDNLKAAALDPNWPDPLNVNVLSQYFYDKMPPPTPPELADFATSAGTPVLYPPGLEGTFGGLTIGRLCAVITRHPPISALDGDDLDKVQEVTTKSFSYDKYGRVVESYVFNGFIRDWNLKLQRQSNVYNVSGQLTRSLFYNSANSSSADHIAEFHYNSLGQADIVSDGVGKTLARYAYNQALGKVQTVTLDENGPNPFTVNYAYDINGGIKEISAQRKQNDGSSIALYDQKLFYDVLPTGSTVAPQYGGNIATQQYSFSPALGSARGVEYQYDALNRMVKGIYTLMDGTTNGSDDAFDEVAGYDNQGRIKYMRRGADAAHSSGGEYVYKDGKSQLAGVNPGMEDQERNRAGTNADPKFLYDANGLLVWDKSKDMRITYDYRDLPVEFLYPQNGTERRTILRYDEAGNRVSKLEFNGGQGFRSTLVDNDPTHPQDYPTLTEAVSNLQSILISRTIDPGEITVSVVVPSYGSLVDIGLSDEFTSLAYNNGADSTPLILVGVVYDSPEYLALIDNRAVGSRWVSAKHYTGIGNEIREEAGSSDDDPWSETVLTDMPLNLGRWETGSAERLYYLKNHLGTSVATVSTSTTGLSDVYEYFSYGKQKQLQFASVDKITPTFTSKELDEGVDLYYFGARYYDADLGMWISPDAVAQFASPYAYSPNPVNSVDPDGNEQVDANFVGPLKAGDWREGDFHGPWNSFLYSLEGEGSVHKFWRESADWLWKQYAFNDDYLTLFLAKFATVMTSRSPETQRQEDFEMITGSVGDDVPSIAKFPKGWDRVKGLRIKGADVFKRGMYYISRDVDEHNVSNGWKVWDKLRNVGREAGRGTYDETGKYIKK